MGHCVAALGDGEYQHYDYADYAVVHDDDFGHALHDCDVLVEQGCVLRDAQYHDFALCLHGIQ